MKLCTSEELKAMTIEKVTKYFDKLHKANEKPIGSKQHLHYCITNQILKRVTFVSYSCRYILIIFGGKMNEDLTERKSEIEHTIRVLEWDKNLKQINSAKNSQLEKYRVELNDIKSKLEEPKETEQEL